VRIFSCDILSSSKICRPPLVAAGGLEERSLLLSLIDILFAYCYDHRTTQGDSTVESAYTITVLSPTLSSFENYIDYLSESSSANSTLSVRDVLIHSARRCLTFPYLRTWKLVKKIFIDITKILFLGQRCVLKCLLQVHRIFEKTDNYYLLNKLYLEDYCLWVQSLGQAPAGALLTELAKECNSFKSSISKNDLEGLSLELIEKSLETETESVAVVEEKTVTSSGENSLEASVAQMALVPQPVTVSPSSPTLPTLIAPRVEPTTNRPLIEVVSSVQFSADLDPQEG
jgi:protein SHQ1